MFKILLLSPDVDQDLQDLQSQYEIQSVTNLGRDAMYNIYLLVEYDIQIPVVPAPPPGTINGDDSSAPKTKATKTKVVTPA